MTDAPLIWRAHLKNTFNDAIHIVGLIRFRNTHGPYYPRIRHKQVNPIHRALSGLPRSRRSIGRRASKDGRAMGETGPNSRLSFFQTLELPRIGAGSLDAFSCKFNLPSVPLKTGGIGWNISGNGFSLVGLI